MKKIKLGDIGSVRMCKRILKEETNSEGGIPFYKISTFGNVADVFIDKDKYENYKTRFSYPKKGEVLISAAGTIGRTVIYNGEDAYFQDSNIVWIENEEKEVLNSFLYYAYQNVRWKTSNGSTILRLYNDDLRNTEILIPEDISEQKRIAKVLSNIDRKISINREINRNLEELAKQIYDYWFVQFDFPNKEGKPYKSSGGKMVWNDVLKREIPDGWEVKSVNDIATSYRGVGYSAKDEKSFKDKNIVLILRGNNISNGHIVYDDNTVYVDKSFVSSEQEIKKYDVIITMSSGSKDHVGKSAMFLFDSPHSYGAFCNKLTPKKNYQFFLANYLHSEYFIKCIRQFASGTGINNLTNEHFSKTIFSFPPNKIISDFNMKVEKIYQQLGIFEQENMKLISLRNSLLPLLMNGQVTLNSCLSHD